MNRQGEVPNTFNESVKFMKNSSCFIAPHRVVVLNEAWMVSFNNSG